jgi:hypothetical protein
MERGAHISELLKKASIPEELESDLEDTEGEESDDDEEQ